MKKTVLTISAVLASTLMANEILDINKIDNREYNKIKNQSKNYTKITTKKVINVNKDKKSHKKHWYNKKVTIQTNKINFIDLINLIVPNSKSKYIDVPNDVKKELIITNVNYINKPIKEILDELSYNLNIYIDYNDKLISVKMLKSRTYQLPVNGNISIKTNVKLGTGTSNDNAIASYLNSDIKISSEQIKNIIKELEKMVNAEDGEYIVFEESTGYINVTARKNNMTRISNYLDSIISSKKQQILAEIKLLRFNKYKNKAFGIQWNKFWSSIGSGLSLSVATNMLKNGIDSTGGIVQLPVTNAGTAEITLSSDSFTSFINALEQYGDVKVVSEPTIMIKNGETTTITSGKIINYIKSVTVTQGDNGNTLEYESGKIQDGFSMVLNATTNDDGTINLFIAPIMNKTLEIREVGDLEKGLIGLPIIDSRSLSLFTKVKNGETIVIGGLKETTTRKEDNSIPLINKIPILKTLTGYKEKQKGQDELIIVVKVKKI